MDPETRRQKLDLCSKLEERDALLKLEANLRKQLELINQSKAQQQQGHVQQNPNQGHNQFPVQHNRLQTSMRRNDNTLTNHSVGAPATGTRPLAANTGQDSSSGEGTDWVFLDQAK